MPFPSFRRRFAPAVRRFTKRPIIKRKFDPLAIQNKISYRAAGRTGTMPKKYASLSMPRYLSNDPYPQIRFIHMTFNKSFSVSTVASDTLYSATSPTFYLNSIYHCDGTSNVEGYPSVAAQYWDYKVHHCDLEVTFTNNNTPYLFGAVYIRGPAETTDLSTLNITNAGEQPMIQQNLIPQSGNQKWTFRKSFNVGDTFGWTHEQFRTEVTNSAAAMGGAPATFSQAQIGVATQNSGSSQSALVDIRLVYYVQLYNRKVNMANV